MATSLRSFRLWPDNGLHNGDRLTQKEFHALYEETAEGFRAQLIDGTVYVAEPVGFKHGNRTASLGAILFNYAVDTPGVECATGTTVCLSDRDEVEPDVLLRIEPAYGGQSSDVQGKETYFVKGAPELVVEIAHSSRSIDLNTKLVQYRKAGVLEYLVLCFTPLELQWFRLQEGVKILPDKAGVLRSAAFPGLWIHEKHLLKNESRAVLKTLSKGLSSSEHVEFISNLAKRTRYT